MLIAKTTLKEHANGAPGLWWAEYRVRVLSDEERARAQASVSHALDLRYCHEQDSEYCQHHPGTWSLWDYGKSAQGAADSCMGDSLYTEAESLHPLHEAMVERWHRERHRDARIQALREMTHHGGVEIDILADEQEKAQEAWESLLRSKRLWKRAERGEIPYERLQELQAPIRQAYEESLKARRAQHEANMRELEALEREAERC